MGTEEAHFGGSLPDNPAGWTTDGYKGPILQKLNVHTGVLGQRIFGSRIGSFSPRRTVRPVTVAGRSRFWTSLADGAAHWVYDHVSPHPLLTPRPGGTISARTF